MRNVLAILVAIFGVAFSPAISFSGDKCGNANCQCKVCDPKCKCCTPPSTEGKPEGQCPGPNCPLTPVKPQQAPQPRPMAPVVAGTFNPSKTPVSPDGVRATADLPPDQHHRNTGGMGVRGPGTGAGLCVFTSSWHAAIWQNVVEVYGFRDWMKNKPGGGWPEKFDKMLSDYCKEKKVEVPGYVQHTGGEVSFLRHALATGRMPCVTYAGRDDFYNGPIAHMVNLAYLDDDLACIIDNNRPGTYVWMPARAFVDRWLQESGGWAIVWTAPPPPPYDRKTPQEHIAAPLGGDPYDRQFLTSGLTGGNIIEVVADDEGEVLTYDEGCTRSKELGVPLVTFVGTPAYPVHGCIVCRMDAFPNQPKGVIIVSKWIGDRHVGARALMLPQGTPDVDTAIAQIDPANEETLKNYGVDFSKIQREKRYSLQGKAATKRQVFDALGTVDDTQTRWNLSFVGSPDDLKKAREIYKGVSDDLKAKVNVQYYETDSWAVKQFGLKTGATLRKPDAPKLDRVSETVGTLDLNQLGLDLLLKLLDDAINPKPPAPTPPDPIPVPVPVPIPFPVPGPVPMPQPAPPAPPPTPVVPVPSLDQGLPYLVVLVLMYLLLRKR